MSLTYTMEDGDTSTEYLGITRFTPERMKEANFIAIAMLEGDPELWLVEGNENGFGLENLRTYYLDVYDQRPPIYLCREI